jgi:Flp pilus assembly protein TadG
MGRVADRLRDEQGQGLVELALILPILLILIFGILDFARAFNYKDQTTQVAAETARWIIVNQLPGNASPSVADYKAWACNEIVSKELKTSVGCPAGSNIQICFEDSAGNASSNAVADGLATVSIPASLTPISYLTSKIPGLTSLKLNGKAQMHVELSQTNTSVTGDSGC